MKLKLIEVKDYMVLVDKSADIKEGDFVINNNTSSNTTLRKIKRTVIEKDYCAMYMPDDFKSNMDLGSLSKCEKIIFADPELGLDLPVIPDWEQWEVDKKIDELLIARGEHPSRVRHPLYGEERELAIGLYSHNKNNYTEENLRNAFKAGANEGYNYRMLEEDGEDLTNAEKEQEEYLDLLIKSLKKLPKYIVVEVEEIAHVSGQDIIYDTLSIPKLITLPNGKQTGIIKEIIWY